VYPSVKNSSNTGVSNSVYSNIEPFATMKRILAVNCAAELRRRALVGAEVGFFVGEGVGFFVGEGVGFFVGEGVGSFVGEGVG